jgi:hypothetical protein
MVGTMNKLLWEVFRRVFPMFCGPKQQACASVFSSHAEFAPHPIVLYLLPPLSVHDGE